MAEPDSLMQLGIEAARDGNKEEARNLFRLLTLQDPANAQAWLWLAGVAENREERQAALERVVEIEPNNEMAVKGLQSLGVQPGSRTTAPDPTPEPVAPAPVSASSASYDPFGDDDDPFAELNNLSNVMAESEGPVRRNEPPPPPLNLGDDLPPPMSSSSTGGSGNRSSASSSSRASASSSASSRKGSGKRPSLYDDDEKITVPARRGLSPLLTILLALVGVLLIGLLVVIFFFRQSDPNVAQQAQQAAIAATGEAATAQALALEPTTILGGDPGTADGTAQPSSETAVTDVPTTAPTDVPATTVPADVAQANPAIVPANTPLQSDGWLYDFNQPTYAAPIIGPLGQYQPKNGRFVVVLVFAVNQTGTQQTIPADFFVLKDAQGRVWTARPEVSDAYVQPGVNADMSHTQALFPDGLTRSVALIFDVAPDATNLVFFSRGNLTQGWLVLSNV